MPLVQDQLTYDSQQLSNLSQQVKLGDITPVLKLYEEDIRSLLKSAITGTLLRMLFIQIQKAKADIDQALSGIDKLLKSQGEFHLDMNIGQLLIDDRVDVCVCGCRTGVWDRVSLPGIPPRPLEWSQHRTVWWQG